MDEALAFLNAYLDALYQETMDDEQGRHDPVVGAALHAFTPRGVYLGSDGRHGKIDAAGRRHPWIGRRNVYLVTRHRTSKIGDVFRCTLGENTPDDDTYSKRVFVVEIDGALKIVAASLACGLCSTTGELPATATRYVSPGVRNVGDQCFECRGSGWVKLPGGWGAKEGLNASKPGKITEVKKLLAPSLPEHLADYNSV